MKKFRKVLFALAAIAAVYIARETGLDQGLVDQALEAAVEVFTEEAPAAE